MCNFTVSRIEGVEKIKGVLREGAGLGEGGLRRVEGCCGEREGKVGKAFFSPYFCTIHLGSMR